jgi:hypothetical protein
MPNLNANDLLTSMVSAAKTVLRNAKLPTQLNDAESTFKSLAEAITKIEEEQALGQMTQEVANDIIEMEKNSSKTELLTLEGIAEVTAEEMINAALSAITTTVNTALGWTLL